MLFKSIIFFTLASLASATPTPQTVTDTRCITTPFPAFCSGHTESSTSTGGYFSGPGPFLISGSTSGASVPPTKPVGYDCIGPYCIAY